MATSRRLIRSRASRPLPEIHGGSQVIGQRQLRGQGAVTGPDVASGHLLQVVTESPGRYLRLRYLSGHYLRRGGSVELRINRAIAIWDSIT